MIDLLKSSLFDVRQALLKKQLSLEEVVKFYQDRISRLNPGLNAVLTIHPGAVENARRIDADLEQHRDKPLLGAVVLLKDIFCTKGLKTTAGSKILENFIPPYSAEVVSRLEKDGCIILGKCNQDEFAMGSTNENSAFGKTFNPWNKDYIPGGSSGASAAAVSAGLCAFSMGTDTGGSVRQPASFCNTVGVKPTYGRVSRYGMVAYASSLDQAGPVTMNVEDSALVLESISGWDSKDSTSSKKPVPAFFKNLKPEVKSLKIGVLTHPDMNVSPDVDKTMKETLNCLQSAGAEIQSVPFSLFDKAISVYYLISTSEASSNLARYDGVRFGRRAVQSESSSLEEFYSSTRGKYLGTEVKRRILMGTYCLSAGYYDQYYSKACRLRRLMRDELMKCFSKVSLLLLPVTAKPPAKFGENKIGSLANYLNDSFTVLSNLTGLPSLSAPAGFSSKNLPIGVQLMAPHFEEQTLLNTALLIQKELKAGGRRPYHV